MADDNPIANFAAPVQNRAEDLINRDGWVLNQTAGTLAFSNTTGRQRVQLSHRSGANLKLDNKSYSFFSPNTYQGLIHGKKYTTTYLDSFETTRQNAEQRAWGDFTVIAGTPNFFTDSIAREYVDTYRPVAAAISEGELLDGGITNNSKGQVAASGRPYKYGGSVEKGSGYRSNPKASKIPEITNEQVPRLTELEQQMGVGGSIKLVAAKHLYLQAGVTPVDYDSSRVITNGRNVTKGFRDIRGGLSEVKTAAPAHQSVDTSKNSPFGDIYLKAMGKIVFTSASGGVDFTTSGEAKFAGTGITSIGGGEVMIGGSFKTPSGEKKNAGRVQIACDNDFFVTADEQACFNSPQVIINSKDETAIRSPRINFSGTGDGSSRMAKKTLFVVNGKTEILKDNECALYVLGDAMIEGSLHVTGDIICDSVIWAQGAIYSATDVIGGRRGVSLVKHRHIHCWGHKPGCGLTSPGIPTGPIRRPTTKCNSR